MHYKSFAKNIENNYFVKLLLVATPGLRMILIILLKFSLFEPRGCSSAVS